MYVHHREFESERVAPLCCFRSTSSGFASTPCPKPFETRKDLGPHWPSKLDEEGCGARWLLDDSRPIFTTNIVHGRDDWESGCVSLLTMRAMLPTDLVWIGLRIELG